MMLPVVLLRAFPAAACAIILTCLDPNPVINFELANGDVKLENSFAFHGSSLSHPTLLGSGGGGAAFSLELKENNENTRNVVGKVSWRRSSESVRNECKILQALKNSNVGGVEMCLGEMEYKEDPSRVMILMEPVIDHPVSSSLDISQELRPTCVDRLVRTMVQMLAANVVTTDVQPLISQRTGQLYLIDMTEAQVVKQPLSFLDIAKVSSFCAEVANFVPDPLLGVAAKSVRSEMETLQNRGIVFPEEIIDILRQQFSD